MPRLTLPKLRALLTDRPSSQVIFLHGDEEYLRDQALREVVEAFIEPATKDFNFDQVRGGDATPETLASLIATPPMMAEHRVVVIRDAQGLSPKVRDIVLDAVQAPPMGTILIVDATIPSGSKAKFYTQLIKGAASVEFSPLDALDVPGWLIQQAKDAHGIEMEVDAARALASAIGAQLGVLSTELEKAASYVGDRGKITLEDIKAVGGYIPSVDRWGWFDKVGKKSFDEAMADLPALFDSGESGVGLLIGLGSHFLKLGLIVAGGSDGLDRAIRPNQRWLIRKLEPQARAWTSTQIDSALADFLRADRLLKSASLTDAQVMEELFLRLMDSAGSGSRQLAGMA